MVNYLGFFGLNENFTKEELKRSYLQKVQTMENLNIPNIDKQFYIEQIHGLYRNAKTDLYRRYEITNYDYLGHRHNFFGRSIFDNIWDRLDAFDNYFNHQQNILNKSFSQNTQESPLANEHSYSEHKTYLEKLNQDNSKTITETIRTVKNGTEDIKVNKYIKYPNGEIKKLFTN
jgi:hypothetical protein